MNIAKINVIYIYRTYFALHLGLKTNNKQENLYKGIKIIILIFGDPKASNMAN